MAAKSASCTDVLMEIDEEELVWQALQQDNVPHPPSPPEDSEIAIEERPLGQHFWPAATVTAVPRHEQDSVAPPAFPSNSDENRVPEWLEEPLKSTGVYVPAPAADKRCPPAEGEVNSLKTPHRRIGEIEGICVSITGPCGNRVYAKTATGEEEPRKCKILRQHEGLLSRPITTLLGEAEEDIVELVGPARESHHVSVENDVGIQKEQDELWVDKYAPKQFTELASDEQVNREVVRWLKEWDPCVFGRKLVSRFHKANSGQQQQPSKKQMYGRGKGGQKHDLSMHGAGRSDEFVTDRKNLLHGEVHSDRPAEKVLLLSGPPGLGKTTLAHVAARHCGYHVVEVNASDDRVAATLQAKILNAVEMRSVMGGGKPNCLIIDEIDGSLGGLEGKAAIDTLLNIISAETKLLEDEGQQGSLNRRPKRKAGRTVKLLRPVICICNDLYAPALRNLRTVARVCKFLPPSCARVATRLKQICSSEGYQASAGALTVLAEQTECDIRLCLHTLQFLHSKRQSLETLSVPSQVLGSRNMIRNIDTMWREVFQSGAKHRRAPSRVSTHNGVNTGTEDTEFHRLYDMLTNNGEFDIADKVHENVLQMRLNDTSLGKVVRCLTVLGDTDIMGRTVTSRQRYYLNAYQPANVLVIRRLVSQQDTPQLHRPTISQRLRSDLKLKREMLRDWQSNMSVAARRVHSIDDIAEDLISPLLAALSPRRLRPVAFQMLTNEEKREVRHLIGCMLTYGITYKQTRADSSANGFDNSRFVMEPPLQSLIMFQNHLPRYCPLSASIQQMLGHEVEMERIRLAHARNISGKPLDMDALHHSIAAVASETSVLQSSKTLPRPLVKEGNPQMNAGLTKGASKKSQKRPAHDITSYFSRPTTGSSKDAVDYMTAGESAMARRDSRPIVFKYQEGFTSAIKRPMFVRDFKL